MYCSDPMRIASSDSSGQVHVHQVTESGLESVASWKAHDYEAWITAFNQDDANIVYTGKKSLFLFEGQLCRLPRVLYNLIWHFHQICLFVADLRTTELCPYITRLKCQTIHFHINIKKYFVKRAVFYWSIGGDDCRLKGWDLRCDHTTPVFNSKR